MLTWSAYFASAMIHCTAYIVRALPPASVLSYLMTLTSPILERLVATKMCPCYWRPALD